MAISQSRLQPTGLDERRIIVGSLIVATFVLIVYLATRPRVHVSTTPPSLESLVVATPESFNDFVGKIQSIDGSTWVVSFQSTDERGIDHQHQYTLTTTPSTTFSRISTVTGTATALAADDFHVGDTVRVAASDNVANVTSFSPTTISSFTSS